MKINKIIRSSLVCTTVVVALLLQGCATPASPTAMALSKADLPAQKNEALTNALSVRNVTGGKETNPLWTSQVDSVAFKTALKQSLETAGVASLSADKGKYFIDAELKNLSQPLFGLTFDVMSTVLYTVEGEGIKKMYPINAVGTATASDSLLGVERLRLANEKSIKENIKQFLRELTASLGR